MSKLYLSNLDPSHYHKIGDASKSPNTVKKGDITYNLSGRYSVKAKHEGSIKFKSYVAIIFTLGIALFSETVREGRKGRKIKVVYIKNAASVGNPKSEGATSLKNAFENCKNAYVNIKKSPEKFIKECSKLSSLIAAEEENETLLNEILNFKNEVRAACLPANEKALKGPSSFAKVKLDPQDQDALKVELKKIREAALKKHFKVRLEKDEKQLNQLKEQWEILKVGKSKDETKFVDSQLKRWEKKLKEGKPLSLPKWTHFTGSDAVRELILKSGVLFDDKTMGGAFVASPPAFGYGQFGLTFSSHIEDTATNDPIDKKVYPIVTNRENIHGIQFDDENQPAMIGEISGIRIIPTLWLGFQRGKNAPDGEKIGIPINRQKTIESAQALNYYKDTTLSYIFNMKDETQAASVDETKESRGFALKNRVQLLNQDDENALRDLISATFTLTLQTDWEKNVPLF